MFVYYDHTNKYSKNCTKNFMWKHQKLLVRLGFGPFSGRHRLAQKFRSGTGTGTGENSGPVGSYPGPVLDLLGPRSRPTSENLNFENYYDTMPPLFSYFFWKYIQGAQVKTGRICVHVLKFRFDHS